MRIANRTAFVFFVLVFCDASLASAQALARARFKACPGEPPKEAVTVWHYDHVAVDPLIPGFTRSDPKAVYGYFTGPQPGEQLAGAASCWDP